MKVLVFFFRFFKLFKIVYECDQWLISFLFFLTVIRRHSFFREVKWTKETRKKKKMGLSFPMKQNRRQLVLVMTAVDHVTWRYMAWRDVTAQTPLRTTRRWKNETWGWNRCSECRDYGKFLPFLKNPWSDCTWDASVLYCKKKKKEVKSSIFILVNC